MQPDEEVVDMMELGHGPARGVESARDWARVAGDAASKDHGAGEQEMETSGGTQHQAGELRQVEAQAGAGRVSRTCKCEAEEAVDEDAWWMLGAEGGDRQVGADVCGWAAGGGASSP